MVWTLRSQSIIGHFAKWAHFAQASVEATSLCGLFLMRNYAFRFGWSWIARKEVYFPMGINCLLPFVKNHLKSVNIKVFKGKLVAVDASCWLHKALSVSMSRTGSFSRWGTNYSWILVHLILHYRSYAFGYPSKLSVMLIPMIIFQLFRNLQRIYWSPYSQWSGSISGPRWVTFAG